MELLWQHRTRAETVLRPAARQGRTTSGDESVRLVLQRSDGLIDACLGCRHLVNALLARPYPPQNVVDEHVEFIDVFVRYF
eukprot:3631490-Prymnesium_polylepis.1